MLNHRQALLLEEVDIYQLPAVDENHPGDEGAQLTIGDLHANTIKLLFMLLKHGVATAVTQEMYSNLIRIYRSVLNKKTFDRYNKSVDEIMFSAAATIRLIGDEVGDRGSNDYYTLKLLQRMRAQKVPVEILLSNHGFEFIKAYEVHGCFTQSFMGSQSISMERLQTMINDGLVTQQEVNELIDTVYKPCLKALSYTIDPASNEITVYTHAPVGLNTIAALAKRLGVKYCDRSADDLARTIDSINLKFQVYVQTNTVHTLNDRSVTNPFEQLMWNRDYTIIDRPNMINGYKINYVHGHDSAQPSKDHVYNLDNQLGKGHNANKNEYSVLYSHDTQQVQWENIPLEPNDIDASSVQLLQSQLEIIRQKAAGLRKRSFINAANQADRLCVDIETAYDYCKNSVISKDEFVHICHARISTAERTLNIHRGWKQTLATLGLTVLCIVTLSVGFFAACAINLAVTRGQYFFFPLKTDTSEKLDTFKHIVAKL